MSRQYMKLIGVLLAALVSVPPGAATAKELASQSSEARGVTVEVKPLVIAADAKVWAFEIALNTHSQELSDDLMRTAVLIDEAGKQYVPLAWDGAAPGGHHRKGVLRFAPISPLPSILELRVTRPGEPARRSFRWQLK